MALADLCDGFELDHLDAALAHVRNWRTAIDGGAHRGIWTAHMAKRFQTVIAFEPVPANCVRIPELENVKVICGLLSKEEQDCMLKAGDSNTGEYHVAPDGNIEAISFLIDAMGLDDLDFLKLDVEGYELFALEGGAETIKRCRPVVCIEEKWHAKRYGLKEGAATRFLEGLGMRVADKRGNDVILTW